MGEQQFNEELVVGVDLTDPDLGWFFLEQNCLQVPVVVKIEEVLLLLKELEYDSKPILTVLNKADKCDPEELENLVSAYDAIAISALDRSTFSTLMMAMEEYRAKGTILTGLLYMDKNSRELHEVLQTSQRPLNELGESDLCPGNRMLKNINASLR